MSGGPQIVEELKRLMRRFISDKGKGSTAKGGAINIADHL
jgi:hypothetical protein